MMSPELSKTKKTGRRKTAWPENRLRETPLAPFPKKISPMLATLTDEPFDNPDWIFEIKWDGYRAIGFVQNGKADIRSRNDILMNERFRPVAEALRHWRVNAVVDGEIIALNESDRADFQQLQNYRKNGGQASLVYYLFDLLWYDGHSLIHWPLIERKQLLERIIPKDHAVIKYSDHVEAEGRKFFQAAVLEGLEGVMAKLKTSEYVPGARTRNWLKVKNNKRLEAVICGFTEPRRSRKYFGAIILGKYIRGKLQYIGHSGSGFDDQGLKDLSKKLKALVQGECPFEQIPKTNMPVTWVKPQLVCEVKFAEWTSDQVLRQPIFLGLRKDKTAANEQKEIIVHRPESRKIKKSK